MAKSDSQLKIYLDPNLHRWFKILTAHEQVYMNDVCNDLIREWVKTTAKKTGIAIDLDK